jgi:hypothetical protein
VFLVLLQDLSETTTGPTLALEKKWGHWLFPRPQIWQSACNLTEGLVIGSVRDLGDREPGASCSLAPERGASCWGPSSSTSSLEGGLTACETGSPSPAAWGSAGDTKGTSPAFSNPLRNQMLCFFGNPQLHRGPRDARDQQQLRSEAAWPESQTKFASQLHPF